MVFGNLGRKYALATILTLQLLCILFLVADAGSDLVGADIDLPTVQGETDTAFELLSVFVLVLCIAAALLEMFRLVRRNRLVESQLRAASGAFSEILFEHFDNWGLTASEKDVAMLAIKGLGIAEIAEIRETRDGTVKAHLNAIYRKAGVKGRPQLISFFVEELMGNGLAEFAQTQEPARPASG